MDDRSDNEMAESAFKAGETPVSRDPNYVRITADQCFMLFLGRDCEISFASISPDVVSSGQETDEDGNVTRVGFRVNPKITELARVRITPDAAITLAMSTLQRLIASNLLDLKNLRESFEDMISEAQSENSTGPETVQ